MEKLENHSVTKYLVKEIMSSSENFA